MEKFISASPCPDVFERFNVSWAAPSIATCQITFEPAKILYFPLLLSSPKSIKFVSR
jgi:hypothetical protein